MRLFSKTTLIIFIIIIFSCNTFAQLSINKGLKGGINYANLFLDPESIYDFSYHSGIVAGVFFELDILGPLSFQVELLYSQKGAKYDTNSEEVKIHLNYFEIPVLIKYNIPIGPTSSFNIQVGPYIGQKLSENWKPNSIHSEDFFKSSDFGITFGAGFRFDALLSHISIDTRYSLGLVDISKDNAEAKNKNLMVVVGIGI